ncbi:hypothetical protein EBR44_13815 [bacterium]|nr:hypothetical protein [bacterium]
MTTATELQDTYATRFQRDLRERVTELLVRYPNVVAPNFVAWEFGWESSCATSDELRELLAGLDNVPTGGR